MEDKKRKDKLKDSQSYLEKIINQKIQALMIFQK